MEVVTQILISAAGSALVALIGWLINTWRVSGSGDSQPLDERFQSLGQMIDYHVREQERQRTPRPRVVIIREKTVVANKKDRQSSDDTWGIIVIAVFVIGFLSWVWQTYKIYLFGFAVAVTILGWTSSFYFSSVLSGLRGRLQWEDTALTFGSMAVWALGIFGITIGVYSPLFAPGSERSSFILMSAQAYQVIGVVLIYTAIVTAASLQFAAGSIYRKALSNRLPNRLEVWFWKNRLKASFIVVFTTAFGFILVSGLVTYLLPSFSGGS